MGDHLISGLNPTGVLHALEAVWRDSKKPSERMHVTSFIRNNPDFDRFRKVNVRNFEDWSSLRFTVDELADLKLVRHALSYFGHDGFGVEEAVQWLREHPEMRALNLKFVRGEGYRRDLHVGAVPGVRDGKDE